MKYKWHNCINSIQSIKSDIFDWSKSGAHWNGVSFGNTVGGSLMDCMDEDKTWNTPTRSSGKTETEGDMQERQWEVKTQEVSIVIRTIPVKSSRVYTKILCNVDLAHWNGVSFGNTVGGSLMDCMDEDKTWNTPTRSSGKTETEGEMRKRQWEVKKQEVSIVIRTIPVKSSRLYTKILCNVDLARSFLHVKYQIF